MPSLKPLPDRLPGVPGTIWGITGSRTDTGKGFTLQTPLPFFTVAVGIALTEPFPSRKVQDSRHGDVAEMRFPL